MDCDGGDCLGEYACETIEWDRSAPGQLRGAPFVPAQSGCNSAAGELEPDCGARLGSERKSELTCGNLRAASGLKWAPFGTRTETQTASASGGAFASRASWQSAPSCRSEPPFFPSIGKWQWPIHCEQLPLLNSFALRCPSGLAPWLLLFLSLQAARQACIRVAGAAKEENELKINGSPEPSWWPSAA